MSKIYFISDAHLAYLLYANRRGINQDTYKALLSVVSYIIDDEAIDKTVIFCGDNLDSKSPGPTDLLALQAAVKRLADANIKIYGIEGNHDKVAAKSTPKEAQGHQWVDLVDNMESINKKLITLKDGTTVYGLDYIQGKQIYEELEKAPECDIIVLHQPFAHVSPFEANTLEVEGVPDQVNKAVVFGHVHISDKRKTCKGVWVVSPGAVHAQKLTHPHGAFAVYDTEENTFNFVETPYHREMRRFICHEESDLKEVEELFLANLTSEEDENKPLLGIKFADSIGKEVIALAEKYADKINFFPKVMPSEVSQVTADEVKDLSTEETLDTLFKALNFDKETDKDVYESALSIIEGHPDKVFKHLAILEEKRNEISKTKIK